MFQDGDVEVKSKRKKRKKEQKEAKKNLYSGFIKSATLENGKLEDNLCKVENKEDEEEVKVEKLSDEDLFKAVGGFTGHK